MATRRSFASPRASNRNWTPGFSLVSFGIGLSRLTDEVTAKRHTVKQVCSRHNVPAKKVTQTITAGIAGTPGTAPVTRQAHVCTYDGHEVEPQPAIEYEGQWVVLTENEVDAFKEAHTGGIQIQATLPARELANISHLLDGVYLVSPTDDAARMAYTLFTSYIADTNRIVVGKCVWYGTDRAVVFHWNADFQVLTMFTCNYISNVRAENVALLAGGTAEVPCTDAEHAQARAILGSLPDTFDWYGVRDTYLERQDELIEEKMRTGAIAPKAIDVLEPIPDVREALRASIREIQGVPTA